MKNVKRYIYDDDDDDDGLCIQYCIILFYNYHIIRSLLKRQSITHRSRFFNHGKQSKSIICNYVEEHAYLAV